ncbi:MAG: hypothetical protein A2117_00120 [Candidatus Wildermuthbacteria bacterium GWA2_46_15]|uniref:Uncharacterized protein n=1 Tax=Candidatus Wildermuthbacteria bacterium GWA2_46_15 TaxID=1802443 RepID=A0A1G2QPD3_9BACT|nr:MAG: hypothetical protein A2117_00120 [Candidatus Wildermuthbacteria bacterium GWA2_46_15]
MEPYKFSPIENKEQLLEAIKYTHFKCFELCKKNFGRYLPVAGNIGIFCHYDNEYKLLTELREQLTDKSDNWQQKYYRLHKPIIIPTHRDVPDTVYTYLYVRGPDQHNEVGDVDFVLNGKEYQELKDSLLRGKKIKGIEILNRPDLDLIKLFDPEIDTLSFIGTEYIAENVKVKMN